MDHLRDKLVWMFPLGKCVQSIGNTHLAFQYVPVSLVSISLVWETHKVLLGSEINEQADQQLQLIQQLQLHPQLGDTNDSHLFTTMPYLSHQSLLHPFPSSFSVTVSLCLPEEREGFLVRGRACSSSRCVISLRNSLSLCGYQREKASWLEAGRVPVLGVLSL